MTALHIFLTLFEIIACGLIVYGFAHEDKVIEWEQRQIRTLKMKWNKHKVIDRIRKRRFKKLIWEEFTRWIFAEI